MGKIYYRDHEFSAPLTNILDVQVNNTSIVDHQIASIPILVGTDGNSNGTIGLVPQPTTADRNKFLKSDGTWAVPAGGAGGTADYEQLANLPTLNGSTLIGNTTVTLAGLGVHISTSEPTALDGNNGDIWFTYEAPEPVVEPEETTGE